MARLVRRRTAPPDIRKSQILEAARQCFRGSGFHPTKMADIAEAAGISVGLVYRYFPNKESLIEEIATEDIRAQKEIFLDALSAGERDADRRVGGLVARISAMVLDTGRTALQLEIAAEILRNPRVRAFADQAQSEIVGVLAQRLEEDGRIVNRGEMAARLRVLSGLVSGVALQLHGETHEATDALIEIVSETAKQLILPARQGRPEAVGAP